MAGIQKDSRRVKLKGFTFNSVNGTTSFDITQPGDCNTLIGVNIYEKDANNVCNSRFSLTINSQLILDNINTGEAAPTQNYSNKPMLQVMYPLAGSDSIKLSFTDVAAATYTINIYYYY
jgi:hypothetical protein